MNPKNNSQAGNNSPEEAENDNTMSIDEFFRQLEAKEKDLDISSDLVIEVDETDFGTEDVPDFLKPDLPKPAYKPEFKEKSVSSFFEEKVSPSNETANLQSEIANLQNQIARMETERVEMFEMSRRRQNDFDNYKNRTERERGETFRNQLSNLATQMLPVIDNLNRALDMTITAETQDFRQFVEGIVLVSQQMNEILAEMGVHPINAVGEPFDPHFHEAVATELTDNVPSQTVTAELLRGYRIGDKVIRPSMVKVSVSTNTGNLPQTVSFAGKNSSED